jgi:transcriptional regulator of met regulon
MTTEQLACELYDIYCEAVGGKAFNGDPLPKSEEFFKDTSKEKQANAWRKTAMAAMVLLNGGGRA